MAKVTHRETITLFDLNRNVVDRVSFNNWGEHNYNAGEALIDKHLPQLCAKVGVDGSNATADSAERMVAANTENSSEFESRETAAILVQGKFVGFIEYLLEGDADKIC